MTTEEFYLIFILSNMIKKIRSLAFQSIDGLRYLQVYFTRIYVGFSSTTKSHLFVVSDDR